MTHSCLYSNQPQLSAKFWPKSPDFFKLNYFEKLTYPKTIFCVRGHWYTRRLILLPMWAARSRWVFCTKYPPSIMQAKFPICNDIEMRLWITKCSFMYFINACKIAASARTKLLYKKTATTFMYWKQTLQLNFITSYLCIYCIRSKHAWCGNMGILFIE